jgi:hypothetical protein
MEEVPAIPEGVLRESEILFPRRRAEKWADSQPYRVLKPPIATNPNYATHTPFHRINIVP